MTHWVTARIAPRYGRDDNLYAMLSGSHDCRYNLNPWEILHCVQNDTTEKRYVSKVWSLMPGGRGLLLFGEIQIVFILYGKGWKKRGKRRNFGKYDEKLTEMNMLKNKGNIAFLVKL